MEEIVLRTQLGHARLANSKARFSLRQQVGDGPRWSLQNRPCVDVSKPAM